MIEGKDGGIIDISSVKLIINKLELYIENEEKIITNIKTSLDLLGSYYISDNNAVINTKINNLYSSLSIMFTNKKKYVEYLNSILNSYITMDETTSTSFQSYNIN